MSEFEAAFGRPPTVRASAPGRVNLIGEHTDYNGGLVLPLAIPQRTTVELAPRDDARVEVRSEGMHPEAGRYALGEEARAGTWLDYVQGVTHVVGRTSPGFSAWISSEVPVGSGLSSSAALEVSLLRALRTLYGLDLDDLELAKLGRRAEVEFVGVPVGLMDQLAASFADREHALLVDFATLDIERIAIPAELGLGVVGSGQRHANASGDFAQRRRECDEAAARLGVGFLSELGLEDLPAIAALPSPLDRRARHVVTENARVRVAAEALRQGDVAAFGQLVDESHASMRDDYECSTVEIDELVALARSLPGVLGARLTGAGWGGSIVVITRAGAQPGILRSLVAQGSRIPGLDPVALSLDGI